MTDSQNQTGIERGIVSSIIAGELFVSCIKTKKTLFYKKDLWWIAPMGVEATDINQLNFTQTEDAFEFLYFQGWDANEFRSRKNQMKKQDDELPAEWL